MDYYGYCPTCGDRLFKEGSGWYGCSGCQAEYHFDEFTTDFDHRGRTARILRLLDELVSGLVAKEEE